MKKSKLILLFSVACMIISACASGVIVVADPVVPTNTKQPEPIATDTVQVNTSTPTLAETSIPTEEPTPTTVPTETPVPTPTEIPIYTDICEKAFKFQELLGWTVITSSEVSEEDPANGVFLCTENTGEYFVGFDNFNDPRLVPTPHGQVTLSDLFVAICEVKAMSNYYDPSEIGYDWRWHLVVLPKDKCPNCHELTADDIISTLYPSFSSLEEYRHGHEVYREYIPLKMWPLTSKEFYTLRNTTYSGQGVYILNID